MPRKPATIKRDQDRAAKRKAAAKPHKGATNLAANLYRLGTAEVHDAIPATNEPDKPWTHDNPAARLCRAADKSGIGIDAYLERNGLVGKYTTQEVATAKALERTWEAWGREAVLRMGGSVNGEKRQTRTATLSPTRRMTSAAPSFQNIPKPDPIKVEPTDEWHSVIGSTGNKINEVLLDADSPMTDLEIAEAAGTHPTDTRIHLEKLVKAGRIAYRPRRKVYEVE